MPNFCFYKKIKKSSKFDVGFWVLFQYVIFNGIKNMNGPVNV